MSTATVTRKKATMLFPKLNDMDVATKLERWRNLASDAESYQTRLLGTSYWDVDESTEKYKKYKALHRKIRRLRNKPYKNSRKELQRWRELYQELRPALRIAAREACNYGINRMNAAKALYENRPLRNVVTMTVTFEVNEDGNFQPGNAENYQVAVSGAEISNLQHRVSSVEQR